MKRVFLLSRLSGVTVDRMVKVLSLSLALLALGPRVAWAGSICPGASGSNPFPHPPDPSATGCNVVITIHADRSATVAVTDSTAYENSEDVIVGIQNNSSSTVPALSLTSPNGPFGFEGDGMCVYTFVGSSYCSAAQMAGTDPYDYQGPTSSFSNIGTNGLTGTVNFNPAIPAGGSTYFSLEGPPSVSLVVGVGPGGGSGTPSNVPTLSVWALALLAGLLMSSSLWLMRNKA